MNNIFKTSLIFLINIYSSFKQEYKILLLFSLEIFALYTLYKWSTFIKWVLRQNSKWAFFAVNVLSLSRTLFLNGYACTVLEDGIYK